MGNVYLRDVSNDDKDNYIKLQRETWVNPKSLDDENAIIVWERMLNDEYIKCAICAEKQVLGFCGIKNNTDVYPEIEIEIFKKYQHKGIGYRAVELLLRWDDDSREDTVFISRVMADNYPCILLMKKMGAKPAGIKRSKMIDERDVDSYYEKHKNLLNDNLRKIADVFDVETAKLLSHELIFHIANVPERTQKFEVHFEGDLSYTKDIERNIFENFYKDYLDELMKVKSMYANNDKSAADNHLKQLLERYEQMFA